MTIQNQQLSTKTTQQNATPIKVVKIKRPTIQTIKHICSHRIPVGPGLTDYGRAR